MSSESESDEPAGPLAGLDPATAGVCRASQDRDITSQASLSRVLGID